MVSWIEIKKIVFKKQPLCYNFKKNQIIIRIQNKRKIFKQSKKTIDKFFEFEF